MSKELLDATGIERTLRRISHEIIENVSSLDDLVIVGIKTRGEFLGKRLVNNICDFEGNRVQFSTLDITHFRDDATDKSNITVDMSELSVDVDDKVVVLVDDVLYTGRTIRAAMDAIMLSGRPRAIRLAVLVDRGHRELPIRADFVGKNLPTSSSEVIKVYLNECDNKEYIEIKWFKFLK